METQYDRSLKRLTSDQGGEFLSSRFKQLSEDCGFTHVFSPAYTLDHNCLTKRANQTILDKTRCMLNSYKLSKNYWAEVDGNICSLNITWNAIEGQAVVDELHEPSECPVESENQELVDEVLMSSPHDTVPSSEPEVVDEV
ncbi:hypothetical protein O181_009253 [Austropuccinia psidii MF-1]|uniref:Integrase catalytic domain-containing protein n=1 Tax=Austropuccinia psidii MF-1 TaxID=1389203 RepID=A0A9Q3GJA2_9BASI|nr:hypothetical protein [Austropuccinia psidii MF-1]